MKNILSWRPVLAAGVICLTVAFPLPVLAEQGPRSTTSPGPTQPTLPVPTLPTLPALTVPTLVVPKLELPTLEVPRLEIPVLQAPALPALEVPDLSTSNAAAAASRSPRRPTSDRSASGPTAATNAQVVTDPFSAVGVADPRDLLEALDREPAANFEIVAPQDASTRAQLPVATLAYAGFGAAVLWLVALVLRRRFGPALVVDGDVDDTRELPVDASAAK